MFKNMLFFILLFSTNIVFAESEKDITSTIEAVTVFLSGAQIERTTDVNYPAGQSTFVFKELSYNVQGKSIQLDGKGDFTILSIQHRNAKKEENTVVNPELKALDLQFHKIQDDITFQQKLANVYAEEKKLILNNWAMSGEQQGVDINNLKQAADFWRSRLSALVQLEIDRQNKIENLKKEGVLLQKKRTTLQPDAKKNFTEVLVKIKANRAGTANFKLSYFVTQAKWTPTYDVRMEQINQPLAFELRANVTQNTQEDWNNVALTLSTGNPTERGQKPELNTQYVNFWQEMYGYNNLKDQAVGYADEMLEEVVVESGRRSKNKESASPVAAAPPMVTKVNRAVATDYEIKDRYTIKGNRGEQVVEISQQEVNADYQYRAVPKLDKSVFLTASIPDWDDYGFMDGPMNLYLEGKYTGESYLNSQTTNDTLILSLGRDKSVIVEREKNKDFCAKKRMSTKTKETIGYIFSVRNKKNSTIDLVIQDQIPISQNEGIEVELIEKSKAKFDESTGFLTWKIELKSSETKAFDFKYFIKHPSKKRIVVQ